MRLVLRSICLLLLASPFALAADPPAEPAANESVRETPLSPEDEQKTFQLADKRLSIDLVAAEPQVDSPVAICWDGDARMYVAEMIDYPAGPPAGRISLLEDRDNDGRYEHATVFAKGLPFPNGVLAARGGLLVTAAPDLLFLEDTDGDGVADKRTVLFTGFAEGNQQLRANGLTWGLDGWIYGANGRSNGAITRPGEPAEKAVSINGRDFRFTPDGKRFEATTGQSQFGQSSDDWGNRFISWNTIPVRHALLQQAFVDRSPRLAMFAVREIADPSDTGQVFPVSPRPKTFNREPTDFYNALAGMTYYRGDALGRDYAGSVFAGESLTNLVHRRALMPEGATFVSRRGEHDREFLASTDNWFHPVYMTTGPDGSLYVVDFYRRWVEHPAFVAESLRDGVDWRQGAGHGRIWKVSHRENTWPPRPQPKLNGAPSAELVKQLESTNGWRRDTAHRLLVERNDASVLPALRTLLAESKTPQAKVHVLGILKSLKLLDDGLLIRALEDGDEHVRQFAVRLAAPRMEKSPSLRTELLGMVDFPSPLLRFHLAVALANIEGPDKIAALTKLADLETRDQTIGLAIIGSLGKSAGGFLTQLVKEQPNWRKKPSVDQMRILREAAAAVAASKDDQQLSACFQLIAPKQAETVGPGDLAMLAGFAQGIADRGYSLKALLADPPEGLKPHIPAVNLLLAAARTLAAREDAALEHRLVAVDVLGTIDAASGPALLALIGPEQAQPLQSAAAAALADTDAETAEKMFARWNELTIATRRALVAAALRSPKSTAALVTAIEGEQVLPRELDPAVRDALLAVRDPALEPRIKQLLESQAAGRNRDEVVARFTAALEKTGDRAHGAALFEKHCLVCHTVQTRGNRVGPDLSGVGARPKETILVDVFDPSRQVTPEFVAYTLLTREGQVMSGVLVSETPTSITLRRAEGAQDFVRRDQIEELRSTGKSLMPEGLEENLSEADVADLLAFLSQPNASLFSKPMVPETKP
jgi:putative membrane-bound dehydrogenase-like protein